jgi:5-methylcytosine-specific restriction protein B
LEDEELREEEFKHWLEEQEYKASTISTQRSHVRLIEQAYGDVDQVFDRDAFSALLQEFAYTAKDRAANKSNPSRLELWGDTYRDLAHLRATINYYKRFREGVTRSRRQPFPNKQAVEKAMEEYTEAGPLAFMDTYGFSWKNVEHYVVRDQNYFPAKAIFGVSHQYMPSGSALDSKDCDGAEAHRHLASIDFEIAKRGPVILFGKDGHTYEPIAQTNTSTGRRAYRFRRTGASNRTEDAVETNDLTELCRAVFVDGFAARISANNGAPASYLTYPGEKFAAYWLRPDIAERIKKSPSSPIGARDKTGVDAMTSSPSNIILHGPPGTGKTWRTAHEAVLLCDGSIPPDRDALMTRYRALEAEKRIAFVTFHQSMDYESFVEGLRPETEGSDAGGTGFRLEARPGIFREICSLAEQARRTLGKRENAPLSLEGRQFWKMGLGAIGTDDEVYEEALAGNYIALGWGGSIDWSDPRFENIAEVEKEWKAKNPKDEAPSNYNQLWPFRTKMKIGDIVIVPYGNSAFRAVAEVAGDYQFVPGEDGNFNQRRRVKWLLKLAEPLPLDTIVEGNFTMRTLYPITETRLKKAALSRLLASDQRPATDRPDQEASRPDQFVLIIDEINRANVSKVFGELITLIEPDKRLGQPNALEVLLPYSRKPFGVPENLHIVGTMNTADRSIALLDAALRRRFQFVEMEPDPTSLAESTTRTGLPLDEILQSLNDRIEYLLDRDHRIGHAFFINCLSREDVDRVMRDEETVEIDHKPTTDSASTPRKVRRRSPACMRAPD